MSYPFLFYLSRYSPPNYTISKIKLNYIFILGFDLLFEKSLYLRFDIIGLGTSNLIKKDIKYR